MKNAKKLFLLMFVAAACTVLLTECVNHPDDAVGPGNNGQGGGNGFDFATVTNVKIDIDYGMKGNKALFEVFAENPMDGSDSIPARKDGVKSLLKAYTDHNCKYSGMLNLPTATGKVWLYSETYGLPTCVEVEVTASGISFNLDSFLKELESASLQQGPTAAAQIIQTRSGSTPDNVFNIQTSLGNYDKNGKPAYLEAAIANVPEGMMNRVQNVLLPGTNNSQYAKPSGQVNIKVTQDAHLTLVFLAELAQWTNSFGYYCYDTNHPPTTLDEFLNLPKYVVFPNCSMYNYQEDYVAGYYPPMRAGMQVKLKYFDADGRSSDIFPAGVTVGWFIMPGGFNTSWGQLVNPTNFARFKTSNNDFNLNKERVCVSLYDTASGKTILGFEDGADSDYKDMLFYVDADPADAIYDPERPTTTPDDEKYPDITGDALEGTLAFEDLWPSKGDYDMNDVVIRYSTVFTIDKDNRLVAIKDIFTPLHSGGSLKSAFGYQLDIPRAAIKNIKIDNLSSTALTTGGLEAKQERTVIMLFDNIHQAVKKGPITVEIELDGSISVDKVTRKSLYNPFICPSAEGFVPGSLRKEIHLTNYAPTSLADLYFFGLFDDKSSVDKAGNPIGPNYYSTSLLYPFAIDLPITDYRIPDETVKIDTFYPDFAEWVNSKGEKNKEWYLKWAK